MSDFGKILALLAPPAGACGGAGGHWVSPHWDSGHPDYFVACAGCAGCVPATALANFFAALPAAPALAAFAALAAVGEAVASAAGPAKGVSMAVTGAIAVWNGGPYKGAWYQVTAKRGNARKVYGLVGECTWVGESEYARFRRTAVVTRVGLKAVGADKPVYVPATCVTRVAPPAEALPIIAAREEAAAVKAALPRCTASKGDVLRVVRGKYEGRLGRVFWIGAGKNDVMRYGLNEDLGRRRGRCESPMWVDATEVEHFAGTVGKTGVATCAPPATPAVPTPAPTAPLAPATVCGGRHTKGDGSWWVSDTRGIPVARVCDSCRAAKVAGLSEAA